MTIYQYPLLTNTSASAFKLFITHAVESASSAPDDPAMSQVWYWTATWQRMEAEAEQDLAEGNFRLFDKVEEFLNFLDSDEDDD